MRKFLTCSVTPSVWILALDQSMIFYLSPRIDILYHPVWTFYNTLYWSSASTCTDILYHPVWIFYITLYGFSISPCIAIGYCISPCGIFYITLYGYSLSPCMNKSSPGSVLHNLSAYRTILSWRNLKKKHINIYQIETIWRKNAWVLSTKDDTPAKPQIFVNKKVYCKYLGEI